jgi:hypothetical protein
MLRSSRAAVLRTKRPEIETRQNDQFVASWTREFLRRGTAAYNDIGDREVEVQMAGRPAAARVRWSRTAVVVARTAGSDRQMRPVEGPPGDEREREWGGDRKSSEHAAADGCGAVAPGRVLTLFCHRVQPVHRTLPIIAPRALDDLRRDQRTQQAQGMMMVRRGREFARPGKGDFIGARGGGQRTFRARGCGLAGRG